MNIPNIRLLNQQLVNPLFHEPKELVSWMGAMQAFEISYDSSGREGFARRGNSENSCDASHVASGGGRGYPLDAETFGTTYYFGQ